MHSNEILGRQITFFFRDYLLLQRGASVHTIHSYRDTLRLLLVFIAERVGRRVSDLTLDDLDAQAILGFLEHIEHERGVSAATRNIRLAAIRTFFRIVAANVPSAFEQCQQVLAIPAKRATRKPIDYLERDEMEALLSVIDRTHPLGRRDYALFAFMYNSGARIQEALDLNAVDLQLRRPFHARLMGKGRKERICPIWPETAQVLRDLLEEREIAETAPEAVFVNRQGNRLSRKGAAYLLRKHVTVAGKVSHTLTRKRVHPHSLRHTTAMHMLRAGNDRNVVADFLGHAHVTTTDQYCHIDLEMKRKAIEACTPPTKRSRSRWRQPDVLEFLEGL